MKSQKIIQKFVILSGMLLSASLASAQNDDMNEIKGFNLVTRIQGSSPSPAQWTALKSKAIQADWAGLAADTMNSMEFANSAARSFSEILCGGIGSTLGDCKATIITNIAQGGNFKTAVWGDQIAKQKGGINPSKQNNDAYQNLSTNDSMIDFVNAMELVKQSTIYGFQYPAGVLKSRELIGQLVAGTNRRLVSYVFNKFLGNSLEKHRNPNRGDPTYLRPDIKKSEKVEVQFVTNCEGCHNSMDPISIGFSHLDVQNDQIVELPNVAPKYFRPYTSATQVPAGEGMVVKDSDKWRNYYTELGLRTNAADGIPTQADLESGTRETQLAMVLGNSQAFSTRISAYIARWICNIEDIDSLTPAETEYVSKIAGALEKNNYVFKEAVKAAAVEAINYGCISDE